MGTGDSYPKGKAYNSPPPSAEVKNTWIYTFTPPVRLHGVVLSYRENFMFTFYEPNDIRGPFAKFVDWWQCAAVMQRETVTVTPSCSGGGNVVVS
jgi:hypothetical protein